MKTGRIFGAIAAALVLFAACSDDDKDYSGDFGQIKVPDTRPLKQTASADDTQTGRGVSFTTEGAWTSSITSSRADDPGWISITPDHGDAAGNYTVKITLTANTTRGTRTATIRIVCGTSTLEIVVTQQGTDKPIPVSKAPIDHIEAYSIVHSHNPSISDRTEKESIIYFRYDDLNRVSALLMDETPDNPSNEMETELHITYRSGSLTIDTSADGKPEASYTVTLDGQERAIEARKNGGTEHWTFAYDELGYCTACKLTGNLSSSEVAHIGCSWTNGNLTALTAFDQAGGQVPNYSYAFDYYPDKPNRSEAISLDLNALLFNVCPDVEDAEFPMGATLSVIGRLGKRSAHLTATNKNETAYRIEISPDGTIMRYCEVLEEIVHWDQHTDTDQIVMEASCTRLVQSIEENLETKEKTILPEEGFTDVDLYKILY